MTRPPPSGRTHAARDKRPIGTAIGPVGTRLPSPSNLKLARNPNNASVQVFIAAMACHAFEQNQ